MTAAIGMTGRGQGAGSIVCGMMAPAPFLNESTETVTLSLLSVLGLGKIGTGR